MQKRERAGVEVRLRSGDRRFVFQAHRRFVLRRPRFVSGHRLQPYRDW